MLFPTMTFALFFVVVLGVSWKLNDRPVQWKLFVLAASYVVLRLGRLEVLLPAGRFDRGQLAGRDGDRVVRATTAPASAWMVARGRAATSRCWGSSSTTGSSSTRCSPRSQPLGSGTDRAADPDRCCPSASRSSRSARSATSSTCSATSRSPSRSWTSRCTCRSSPTWSPGRSCASRSSSRSCVGVATPTRSTPPGPRG